MTALKTCDGHQLGLCERTGTGDDQSLRHKASPLLERSCRAETRLHGHRHWRVGWRRNVGDLLHLSARAGHGLRHRLLRQEQAQNGGPREKSPDAANHIGAHFKASAELRAN